MAGMTDPTVLPRAVRSLNDRRREAGLHLDSARHELMAALRELDGVCSRAHVAVGNAVGLLDDAKVSIASTELDERRLAEAES